MNEDKNFTKLLIIPVIFLVIGIGVFVFIQKNKKTAATDQESSTKTLLDKPFKFDDAELDIKKNSVSTIDTEDFPLYKIDSTNKYFPSQKLAESAANKLDLTQSGQNKWENENYTLTFVETSSYIRLDIANAEKEKVKLEENILNKTAQDLLEEIGLWPFSSGAFTAKTTIFEEQNLNKVAAVLSYKEKIDDKEIYTDLAENAEVYIQFDESGQITQVRYFYLPPVYVEETFDYKSLSDIETAIKNGEYKSISASSKKSSSIQIEKITKTYFGSNSTNFIQPVFLVEGKDQYGEEISLSVLAFKNESYK